MKRILSFFLAFIFVILSVVVYYPIGVYASGDFTVSTSSGSKLSLDEANNAINNKGNIYTSNHEIFLYYTPTSSYNWTLYDNKVHLSDVQAKALLMSNNKVDIVKVFLGSALSNNGIARGLLSALGIATTGNSDSLTNIADMITGNYNYLNSLNYNEDTQTITMSNDNSSVDKLREEIKLQYYKDNGMFYVDTKGNVTDNISSSRYDDMTLYQEDFNLAYSHDYSFGNGIYAFYFNKSDYSYAYLYRGNVSAYDSSRNYYLQFTDKDLNTITLPDYMNSFNISESRDSAYDYSNYLIGFRTWYSQNYGFGWQEIESNALNGYINYNSNHSIRASCFYYKTSSNYYDSLSTDFFRSKDGSPFIAFVSYDKLFDYIHGKSSAYLGSAINKVGEDITFSIKDMNENLGEKMDTLIDTINDKKGSMTADELQNAIDKGLEDLNKTSEDIKDNTEEMNSKLDSVLDALNAQNQTLLAILGVTKTIADTVDDIDEKTDYNSIISTISTIFNAVLCALLYGQNTLKDSDSSAQAQAVSYSDDIAVYSDSGGTYKPNVFNMDLRSGIFGHFPFSMIYHMYDWCAAFVAEAKAPVFTYNYGFLVGDKDNPELTVSIDLSQYEDWRDVAASFMRLAFTLAVAFGSYKRFKEEML